MPDFWGYIHIEITRTLPASAGSLVLPLHQTLPTDYLISIPPFFSFPYKKNLFEVSGYLPAIMLYSPDFLVVMVVI